MRMLIAHNLKPATQGIMHQNLQAHAMACRAQSKRGHILMIYHTLHSSITNLTLTNKHTHAIIRTHTHAHPPTHTHTSHTHTHTYRQYSQTHTPTSHNAHAFLRTNQI